MHLKEQKKMQATAGSAASDSFLLKSASYPKPTGLGEHRST